LFIKNSYHFFLKSCLFVFFLATTKSNAQEVYYEQFTMQDGLPSMTVYEIVQDSNNILWFGTDNGLVSYDGVEFKTHTHPDLIDNEILELYIDKDGNVGFLNLSNQYGVIFKDSIGIKTLNINAKDNLLDLLVSNNTNYTIYAESPYRQVYNLDSDKIEKVNYSLRNSIMVFRDSLTSIKSDNIKIIKYKRQQSRIYFLKTNEVFGVYGPELTFTEFDEKIQSIINLDTLVNFQPLDSLIYLSNNNGLFTLDYNYRIDRLIKNIPIQFIFIDKESNIWISTNGYGILKISQSNFINIVELESYLTKDFVISKNEGYIINNNFLTIYNFKSSKKTKINIKNRNNSFIHIEHDSLKYILLRNKNYSINDNSLILQANFRHNVKCISCNNKKCIVGTRYGVIEFSHNNSSPDSIISENCLNVDNIYAVQISPNNNYFIGSLSGLYLQDSLCNTETIDSSISVSCFHLQNDRWLWIGTKNEGIKVYDTQTNTFNKITKIPGTDIYMFTENDQYIYAATNKGLFRYNKVSGTHQLFNKETGLPTNLVNVVATKGDTVFINLKNSIVGFPNSELDVYNVKYALFLEKVIINGHEIVNKPSIEYEYFNKKFDFYFKSISLSSDNTTLDYRFYPLQLEWQSVNNNQPIQSPLLDPGTYTLQVRTTDLKTEVKTYEHTFTIFPAWWASTTAKYFYFLGSIILINVFIFNSFKEPKSDDRYMNILEARASKFKSQSLQLQMNPHFIFNAVSAVQKFLKDNTKSINVSINFLSYFSDLVREMFKFSDYSKIPLSAEVDFLKQYIKMEKLRFPENLVVNFNILNVPTHLMDKIQIPPLIIQPVLENSFKHGVAHLQNKSGFISLEMKRVVDLQAIIVTILDNGVGREFHRKNQVKDKVKLSSGMGNSAKRLADSKYENGKSTNQRLVIEDLYDDNGNPLGTKTIIEIRYSLGENFKQRLTDTI